GSSSGGSSSAVAYTIVITGSTTNPTPTSGSGSTTPSPITPAQLVAANKRVIVTVTRTGSSNVVAWTLPTTGLPGTVAGVQIWRSNSPYTLVQTLNAGSSGFRSGSFTDTGSEAKPATDYLVTMFYGPTEALGLFTASTAPDTAVYTGSSSQDSAKTSSTHLPNWAIVLIVIGVLFLIVLVAILVARG